MFSYIIGIINDDDDDDDDDNDNDLFNREQFARMRKFTTWTAAT